MSSGASRGKKLFTVGLTGGIGSGKSTVADMFSKLGAVIIDTDVIAHRLTQSEGAAISAIRSAFGNEYIEADGALNRDKMRGLIISDAAAKRRLESILHPLILEQTKSRMEQMKTAAYVILVVPLLLESPAFRRLIQRILVVDCTEDKQIDRVVGRSGMSKEEVRSVIALQTPRSERLKLADDVIHNDSGLESLAQQVAVLHKSYLSNL